LFVSAQALECSSSTEQEKKKIVCRKGVSSRGIELATFGFRAARARAAVIREKK
jgi:hypothetical protein